MSISKDYRKETKKAAKEARRSILSVEQRAENLGMTKTKYLSFRVKRNLQNLVDSTPFNICVAFLILTSVALIFAEFLLPPGEQRSKIVALSDIATWIFVFELLLRYFVAPNKKMFFKNFWLDIIAVLPVLRVFRTFRILRLTRLLRLSRAAIILLRQSGWLSSRIEKFFGSFGVLLLSAIMLIICGTLMMLSFENSTFGDFNNSAGSTIPQFLEKIWLNTFLFISGEVVGPLPASAQGKLIAVLISISGMVVFAIMVGTISASMTAYFRTRVDVKDLSIGDLENHIIICGWDRMGEIILSELEAMEDTWMNGVVVIAETERNIIEESNIKNPRRLFHICEDFTKMDILAAVGAKKARAAIVLADKGENLKDQDRDARTVLAALTLEKLNPNIFTCAELLDEVNATHLKIAGVEEIISRATLTAGLFASTIVNKGVSSIISDVLTHKEGTYLRKIKIPEEFINKPYIDVFNEFKRKYNSTILAVEWIEDSGELERHINPMHHRQMDLEDILVIITNIDSKILSPL